MNHPRIRHSATLLALGAAAALSLGAVAGEGTATPAPTVQASIPFVDHHSIRDWQADGKDGLWVQDVRRNWYYAKLLGPCIGLDFALSIGFDTGPSNQLDKFSSIIVPREGRCQITSFTRSDPPPPTVKKKKHKVTEAKPAT
ncbi:MAG TPA: DUF6491 family protein [Steroidobacteraceae bacterium]|nr:DUF6491 family protein [Steroidobacteraceae bacterium]